ncbi:MAG: hypothetical protein PHV62_03165 [Sulfuricurvum sp.]|nr:hypothetical protein [Sulfuricurvum sp.]
MSDEALKDAKIAELEKQNDQLNRTVQAFSGQIRARTQAMNELFEANTNLRSSSFLMEDLIKRIQSDNQALTDRVNVLEKEKKELQVKLEEFEKLTQPADAA